jgi:hypothetical protein
MPPKRPPPQALPIHSAMDRSDALARLMQRVRDSNARFEAVRECLPTALRAAVQAGPVDESGNWCLLAANAAAAAKLRQLVPLLQEALREQGWQDAALRIKVKGRA